MKISQLPEHVKIKALEYQKQNKGGFVWDKKTDNLAVAFEWGNTKEGHDYWQYWYDKEFIEVTFNSNTFVGPSAGKTIIEEQIWKVTTTDTIVLSVMEDLNSRSILVGVNKHKRTLDREDLSRKDWLQHAYEECLDQANYLKKLISLEK
jgi:hypothetical protein